MERITIKVVVDGEELAPFSVEAGEEDHVHKDDVSFFGMGHVYNKEGTKAPYDYTVRLVRHKTEEERRENSSRGDE